MSSSESAVAPSCKKVGPPPNPNTHCVCPSCRTKNAKAAAATVEQTRRLDEKQAQEEAEKSSVDKVGEEELIASEEKVVKDRTSIQTAIYETNCKEEESKGKGK